MVLINATRVFQVTAKSAANLLLLLFISFTLICVHVPYLLPIVSDLDMSFKLKPGKAINRMNWILFSATQYHHKHSHTYSLSYSIQMLLMIYCSLKFEVDFIRIVVLSRMLVYFNELTNLCFSMAIFYCNIHFILLSFCVRPQHYK